jgi:hypothetical protein
MQMLCVFVGCLIYAKYHQCDPLRAKMISRSDQVKENEEFLKIKIMILI